MADITPTFSDLTPIAATVPNVGSWYKSGFANGIPDTVAPFLAAQGFEIIDVTPYHLDGEFAGWALDMRRTKLQNAQVVQSLLESMTQAYNEGRAANDTRYEDLLRNLSDLLDKSQTSMDSAGATLDERVVLYMADIDGLETVYDEFFVDLQSDLEGLTVTLDADRTRVNNQFDGLVSTMQQGLVDRGLYSAMLFVSMEAGIEEKRALALTEISEREQRLIADIALRKNEIYISVLKMRTGLIEAKLGLTNRQQEFLAYQLDTTNKLALAMFGFVERREDAYPGMADMAGVAASLGESGAAAS